MSVKTHWQVVNRTYPLPHPDNNLTEFEFGNGVSIHYNPDHPPTTRKSRKSLSLYHRIFRRYTSQDWTKKPEIPMNWTHPLCDDCWHKREPEEPHRLVPEIRHEEVCGFCGTLTRSGIYVREDPALVPFARHENPTDQQEFNEKS